MIYGDILREYWERMHLKEFEDSDLCNIARRSQQ